MAIDLWRIDKHSLTEMIKYWKYLMSLLLKILLSIFYKNNEASSIEKQEEQELSIYSGSIVDRVVHERRWYIRHK